MVGTRRNPDLIGDLLQIAIPVTAGVVGWKLLENRFPDIFGKPHIDPVSGQAGGGSSGGSSGGGASGSGVTAMGTGGQPTCNGINLTSLAQGNSLRELAVEWRAARWANYQDPDDWNAFTLHVQALAPQIVAAYPNILNCPWQGWPDGFGGSYAPPAGQIGHRA